MIESTPVTVIKAAVLFAEGLFVGESLFALSHLKFSHLSLTHAHLLLILRCPKEPSNQLRVPVKPERDVGCTMFIQAMVGTRMGYVLPSLSLSLCLTLILLTTTLVSTNI